jgi:hypothetical protein
MIFYVTLFVHLQYVMTCYYTSGYSNPTTRLSKIAEWNIRIELEWLRADIPFQHAPNTNVAHI